jgi:hypothetical protein
MDGMELRFQAMLDDAAAMDMLSERENRAAVARLLAAASRVYTRAAVIPPSAVFVETLPASALRAVEAAALRTLDAVDRVDVVDRADAAPAFEGPVVGFTKAARQVCDRCGVSRGVRAFEHGATTCGPCRRAAGEKHPQASLEGGTGSSKRPRGKKAASRKPGGGRKAKGAEKGVAEQATPGRQFGESKSDYLRRLKGEKIAASATTVKAGRYRRCERCERMRGVPAFPGGGEVCRDCLGKK